MIKRILIATALVALCAAWTHGSTQGSFTYYVDSVNGNDANPGTSINQAKKNITALPTITSGQSICLVGGSYWRQFLNLGAGSPLSSVTVSGCGGGAQPTIDASDVISTGVWSKTGGLTVTYNTTALTAPASYSIGNPFIDVFENGNYLAYEASQAAVDANAGTYTVSSNSTSTATIYVHANGGGNPATNGKTYEYTSRPDGLYLNAGAGDVVSNVNFKRGGSASGGLQIIGDGSNPTVNGITCTQGSLHCVQMPAGSIQNTTFNDIYSPTALGTATELVFYEGVGSGNAMSVTNTSFSRGSTVTAINSSTENVPSAIFFHTGALALGQLQVTGGSVVNNNPAAVFFGGFGGTNGSTTVFSGVSFTDIISPLTMASGQTLITSNLVYVSNNSSQAYMTNASSGGSWTDTGSTACAANVQGGLIRKTDSAPSTISLNNFVFYAQPTQNNTVSLIDEAGTNLSFTVNNSTIDVTAVPTYSYLSQNSGDVYVGDNNHFPGVSHWVLNGTNVTTLSAWRTLSGQDAASDTAGFGGGACGLSPPGGFLQFVVIF